MKRKRLKKLLISYARDQIRPTYYAKIRMRENGICEEDVKDALLNLDSLLRFEEEESLKPNKTKYKAWFAVSANRELWVIIEANEELLIKNARYVLKKLQRGWSKWFKQK